MHILIVADGRSPITRRWIPGVLALGHRVTLISTFPCTPLPGVEQTIILSTAFGGAASGNSTGRASALRPLISRFRRLFLSGRYLLGPLTLPLSGKRLARLVKEIKPDLVHALRIPFEGMLASYTPANTPLILSTWGNDLTLHAPASPLMSAWTRRALRRADGLITDAGRDIRLAPQWGFDPNRPTLNILTSGGIDLTEMGRIATELPAELPGDVPLIINPRGIRPAYARTDTFFQAIPLVLQRWPNVCFVCPGMAGQAEAEHWANRIHRPPNLRLLAGLPQPALWNLFSHSDITLSITTHDGTPNTLLEAMACGCLPIAGDIESLREWITPGINGLLVDPHNPQALAEAIVLALTNPTLRHQAAELNLKLIQQRAEINLVRAQLAVFYQRFTS
ncbi:MAG: glycosyltransferase family 4 protein [Anaerolinea sp.]|nr:glycosyltransferase family 4 protein [Anaerolinea sp.]